MNLDKIQTDDEINHWNEKRIKLEELLKKTAIRLIKHAGCNHITIPFVTNKEMFIQIKPQEYED